MSILHEDIIAYIGTFLKERDLISFSLVSKQFYKLSKTAWELKYQSVHRGEREHFRIQEEDFRIPMHCIFINIRRIKKDDNFIAKYNKQTEYNFFEYFDAFYADLLRSIYDKASMPGITEYYCCELLDHVLECKESYYRFDYLVNSKVIDAIKCLYESQRDSYKQLGKKYHDELEMDDYVGLYYLDKLFKE